MKINFKKAIINFILAYIVVTILCYSVTIITGIVLKLPTAEELGVGIFKEPAFVLTVSYHLLINLFVWTIFAWFYFRKNDNDTSKLKESVFLGFFWLITALLIDMIGFVIIKSPFSMTFYQFYIEYQPWISITYFFVFIGPILSYAISRIKQLIVS